MKSTSSKAFTKSSIKKKGTSRKPLILGSKPKHLLFKKGSHLHRFHSNFNITLLSKGYGFLSAKQIAAFRKTIHHKLLRKLFLTRAFPTLALTQKPPLIRMGKGKGTKISAHVFPCQPGSVLFEIFLKRRVRLTPLVLHSLTKASMKLPFRTSIANLDL
jgi:ribosomal protein L16/L10AE